MKSNFKNDTHSTLLNNIMNSKVIPVAFFLMTIIVSCQKEEIVPTASDSAFGIRHDKNLSDYEAIARSNRNDLPNFNAVVNFSYSLDGSNNKDYTASGTLIDKQWILTAGHNFFVASEQNKPALISGIQVKIGNDPNNPDSTLSVSEIILHPTWLAGDQNYNDANDLCLVKLSNPINTITPVDILSSENEVLGSTVWFCGFGDYSNTSGQDSNLESKKHAMNNILDRITNGFKTSFDGIIYSGGLLAFDFDNPTGTINSLGDENISTDEKTLGIGTSDANALDFESSTVEGDSGGPLFIKNNGDWQLAGVLAGGASEPIEDHKDGDYGDISIFIRVASSYNWIQSVIE